jgi:hypothetical protein
MSGAAYRVHRLIQDLNRDARLATMFLSDPDRLFEQYALAENERLLLREGTPEALMRLGVHPNLQMKFLRIRRVPGSAGSTPLASYLRELTPGA